MKSESEQLTETTTRLFAQLELNSNLTNSIANLNNIIQELLDEQEFQPKRDFKYFVYGGLTVSVIVALVCLVSGG